MVIRPVLVPLCSFTQMIELRGQVGDKGTSGFVTTIIYYYGLAS